MLLDQKLFVSICAIWYFAFIGLLIAIYVEDKGIRVRSCPGARV